MSKVEDYIEYRNELNKLEKRSDSLIQEDDFDPSELNDITDKINTLQEKIDYLESFPEVADYVNKQESKEAEEYNIAKKVVIEHHHFREKTLDQAYNIVEGLRKRNSEHFIAAVGAFKEVFNKDFFEVHSIKEKEESERLKLLKKEEKASKAKKARYKMIAFIAIIVLAIIVFAIPSGNDDSSSKSKEEPQTEIENYNDNSKKHQEDAYFAVKHEIQANLKDADSYEIVNYVSNYNESEKCYQVTVKYKATNGFGGVVTEMVKGAVVFDKDGNTTVTDLIQIQ